MASGLNERENEKNVEDLLESLEVEDEDNENTNKDSEIDTDFVDEVLLKDIEVDLTDEELTKKRTEAIEIKNSGNALFASANFEEAKNKYTSALRVCPLKYENDRSILYCNRAACYMKRGIRLKGIEDCNKAIELNENYLKAYIRRAMMHVEEDKLDEGLEDYKKVFELDRTNKQAAEAIATLPEKINEKNEKLKEQMLGTLKDLGNKILRPFGLSTDNFKLQPNPDSGGYSINFQQNTK